MTTLGRPRNSRRPVVRTIQARQPRRQAMPTRSIGDQDSGADSGDGRVRPGIWTTHRPGSVVSEFTPVGGPATMLPRPVSTRSRSALPTVRAVSESALQRRWMTPHDDGSGDWISARVAAITGASAAPQNFAVISTTAVGTP